jgi:hypothetical protein
MLLVLTPAMAAASTAAVAPPHDPAVAGPLTLCSQQGKQITSGSLATKPAVWRAVNSTPAPQGYGKGGTATLFAFQPRPSTLPAEWSGEQLTASARYTVVAHPMAAATTADESLTTYLGDYPLMTSAKLIQLRIYLAAPNAPALRSKYDATYLHVSNGKWRQLNPGPADCASAGKAVSLETLTLPPKTFKTKSAGHPGQPASARTGKSPGASPSPTASADSGGTPTDAASATHASSGTSDTGRNVAIAVCLVLLAAMGAIYAFRRRS